MGRETSRGQKVVDFQQWRRDTGRDLAPASPAAPAPERRSPWLRGLLRVLALFAGLFFCLIGTVVGGLFLAATLDQGWSLAPSLVFPAGIAFFGLNLTLVGLLGPARLAGFWRWAGPRLGRTFRPLSVFLVVAGYGVAVGLIQGRTDPSAWSLAILLGVGLFHIVAHEAGHLVAAYWARYIPHHLVAGPLRVQLSGYRPRFGANRDWRCMLGGQVLYTRIFPSKRRDLAVLAAGPLVNLVILIAALAILFWGPEGGLLEGLAWANIWFALFVLVENLIPLPRTLQGVGTDGRQILDILRGRQPA